MTAKDFPLPDLGEGLTESEIVSWKVAEGDAVTLNQVIAEVETAKALVELPSPFDGTIARLYASEGETVQVGQPIVSFELGGDTDSAPTATTAKPEREPVLVGWGPKKEGGDRPRRRRRSWDDESREQATPERQSPADSTPTPDAAAPPRPERPRSTPPVRTFAKELGIDLTELTGTGPDGVITREDVQRANDSRAQAAPDGARRGSTEREVRTPIRGVRKATAAAMVSSAFTAPHATEFLTVDVTRTSELVTRLRAQHPNRRITVMTIVAKAMLFAVRRTPEANSHWDDDAQEIVQYGYVNLGVAAATARGLVVPVVRDADALGFVELADAITELVSAARDGSVTPEQLGGGTLSLTNVGVFGVDAGTPILTPGQAAILAAGAVRRRPWEHDGGIELRDVLTLSLSFDHRLLDGEQASRFLVDVGRLLEEPGTAFALA
ncbi:pyruvate dehydrogenase E2 component (dihydrolipoamide acetyltransferase) [Paramicrobacterium humi]|uniref:Dihydrolipoamide acetyltransferase component of pyruvate dehydrogenase complex n=1 Tax=Paramicrobacterium humi TaxID=640635 RepID=A0A1H4PQ91_9MICO|nr:dihydrolipoamide acetyltransferase family protein [Microbacterium humi]SEC09362.1 pyruvate dehydrogenase E2 component (dihydrolipoamide acetyltransferase) [Microbacterium humi]